MPDERKPAPVERDSNRDDIETINLFKQFPLWFIGLMFIGISKCCTAEQLFRWLDEYEADWLKCIAATGKLITSRFVQKLSRTELKNLNLPEDCIIFYPTNRGFIEVDKQVSKSFATFCFVFRVQTLVYCYSTLVKAMQFHCKNLL